MRAMFGWLSFDRWDAMLLIAVIGSILHRHDLIWGWLFVLTYLVGIVCILRMIIITAIVIWEWKFRK